MIDTKRLESVNSFQKVKLGKEVDFITKVWRIHNNS